MEESLFEIFGRNNPVNFHQKQSKATNTSINAPPVKVGEKIIPRSASTSSVKNVLGDLGNTIKQLTKKPDDTMGKQSNHKEKAISIDHSRPATANWGFKQSPSTFQVFESDDDYPEPEILPKNDSDDGGFDSQDECILSDDAIYKLWKFWEFPPKHTDEFVPLEMIPVDDNMLVLQPLSQQIEVPLPNVSPPLPPQEVDY